MKALHLQQYYQKNMSETKKILVIEDEAQILEFLSIALSINGYEVITACNGAEGLDYAFAKLPDLIISDIMMPELDGYQVLEAVRANPQTANIPMLLLTARTDRGDVRQGMNLGADDYITKPFDIEDLLMSIKSRLEKKKSINKEYMNKLEDLRTSIRSNLPHEIRTPLNIILGYSNILMKAGNYNNTADVRDMIESINYGAQRLNHLFENYLLYASLELMDPYELKQNTYHCGINKAYIDEIISEKCRVLNRLKDVIIDVQDSEISLSEYYFHKIMVEVLDNALKYSDFGTQILIKSRSELGYYKFKVQDSGRGMNKQQIESIGAYQQFDRELYEQQGAGLGLAICKKIADLFECHFAVNSELGKGTQVEIWIPLARR